MCTWSERQSHAWLAALGVPSAPSVAVSADGPVPLPLPFAYPVAVKACSAQLAHKSEHGGVVLGVADAQGLRVAMEQVKTNVARHAPLPADFEILVQPMVKGLAEVLLGFKRDADAGAIVMLAVGGMWAEVVREAGAAITALSRGSFDSAGAEARVSALSSSCEPVVTPRRRNSAAIAPRAAGTCGDWASAARTISIISSPVRLVWAAHCASRSGRLPAISCASGR